MIKIFVVVDTIRICEVRALSRCEGPAVRHSGRCVQSMLVVDVARSGAD